MTQELEASGNNAVASLPSIAINGNRHFLVTWLDNRNDLPGHTAEIFGSMFYSPGDSFPELYDVQFSSAPDRDHFHPQSDEIGKYVWFIEFFTVLPHGDEFIIPWADDDEGSNPVDECKDIEDVLVGFFDPYNVTGDILEDVFLVDNNGYPEGDYCYSPEVGKEASGYGTAVLDSRNHLIVAFYETEYGMPGDQDIYAQRFDLNNDRNPIGEEKFLVSSQTGDQNWTDIAVNSLDQLYVSFRNASQQDLYCVQVSSSIENPTPLETFRVNEVTEYFIPQGVLPKKRMGIFSGNYDDYIILVWDGRVGVNRDIYAQIYYDNPANGHTPVFPEEFTLNESQYTGTRSCLAMVGVDRFVVTWTDDRNGGEDIYAGIYQLDLDPPSIIATTQFDPPAKVFDPQADPYQITTLAMDNTNGSGLEGDVLLIQTTHPSILYGGGSVSDTAVCEPYVEHDFYRGFLNPPSDPGTYIECYVWAQDKAQNTRTDPYPIPPGFQLYVSNLGDINIDGCYSNVDLAMMEDIIAGEYAPDPDSFFADINQDELIDSIDLDSLEVLIGPYPYIGCIARVPTGPPLELAAACGEPGETNVLVPLFLDNDSSKVSTAYCVFRYDSTVFTIPTLEQTGRSQGIPCSFESRDGNKKVRLLGNDSTYIDPGEGAILKLKVDVASNAPEGSYHFDILRASAADTANQDLLTQPLRGKFFIPEAPPVSIICTPLGDTTLSPADTLTFGTTLTNHSDSTMSPKFFIYGTTTGPDSFTFLAVDTTQIMMLPPGERKHDVTDLEVPSGAPQGPYTFTAYAVSPVTDSTFDDDAFGFQVVGGAGRPGKGQNELLSSGNEMGPWKVLSGWFGYAESKGEGAEDVISSSLLPKRFAMSQNYPNPFNPSTTIRFDVPEGEIGTPVDVSIYDLRGRLVRTLVDEEKARGTYQVHWDGRDERDRKVSSGVYLYRIIAADFVSTRKMVLLY